MQTLPAPTDDREAREREVAARKWLAIGGGRAMDDREAGPKAPKAARTQEANEEEEEEDQETKTVNKDKEMIEEERRERETRPKVMMTTTPTDKRVLRSASRRGK